MTVSFADDEPNGLAELLGGLIEQNLARDPSRHRLLKPAIVALESIDGEVAVTLHFRDGAVTIENGVHADAHVHVKAQGRALLELAGAPLRFGLPDAFHVDGRAVLVDILRREVKVRGLIASLPAVRRLTMLLSAV